MLGLLRIEIGVGLADQRASAVFRACFKSYCAARLGVAKV